MDAPIFPPNSGKDRLRPDRLGIAPLVVVSAFILLVSSQVQTFGISGRRALAGREEQYPTIPRLAGVNVGRDTVESLSTRFGPGVYFPGQHPIGGRAWYVARLHLYIGCDGFDYNSDGRIINTLDIASRPQRPLNRRMYARGLPKSTTFAGQVHLGMQRATVLRLLARLPKPKISGDDVIWHMRSGERPYGYPEGGHALRYAEWRADLHFAGGVLDNICVDCE